MLFYFLPFFSYVIGSIPFGLFIARFLYKIDITKVGSGNIGATNVARTCGKLAGILTFLLDFYKGVIVLIFARIYLYPHHDFTLSHNLQLLICVAGIIGHSFSIFLKFKGGKAVAVSFACLVFMYPSVAVNIGLFWVAIFLLFRIVGIASIASAVLLFFSAIQMWLYFHDSQTFAFFFFIAILILWKHTPNIKDIRAKLIGHAKS
jgi:acyl phosphate:glycerol-3-phosphate acyltransferase